MVEYGQGIGEVSGRTGGRGASGERPADLGAAAVDFVSDAANRVAALPPEGLLLLVVIVLAGLVVLRRAF